MIANIPQPLSIEGFKGLFFFIASVGGLMTIVKQQTSTVPFLGAVPGFY